MCLGTSQKATPPTVSLPVIPPPPPPPAPAPTAQGLTIGKDRRLTQLERTLGAATAGRKGSTGNNLRIDLGSTSPLGTNGLNIPQG